MVTWVYFLWLPVLINNAVLLFRRRIYIISPIGLVTTFDFYYVFQQIFRKIKSRIILFCQCMNFKFSNWKNFKNCYRILYPHFEIPIKMPGISFHGFWGNLLSNSTIWISIQIILSGTLSLLISSLADCPAMSSFLCYLTNINPNANELGWQSTISSWALSIIYYVLHSSQKGHHRYKI